MLVWSLIWHASMAIARRCCPSRGVGPPVVAAKHDPYSDDLHDHRGGGGDGGGVGGARGGVGGGAGQHYESLGGATTPREGGDEEEGSDDQPTYESFGSGSPTKKRSRFI